jgi:hypothetical protein
MRTVVRGCLAGVAALSLAATALAQESKTVALAKQLATALDAGKLDSIAARDSAAPDQFVAALYFPGVQLLVVQARYTVPILLADKLEKKQYRDIYIDLNSASVPESKLFIEDLGTDGLKVERQENQPFDTYDAAGKRVAFDGDWKAQKLSKDDYMKAFSKAEGEYSHMLELLLAELKKTS